MIVLPSIAFGGFSGSAKDVTARHVGGRSILSVRSWPTGQKTNAQVARRASISRITKSYQKLSADQMLAWERLAEHASGQSAFGQKAELSGINLFVRLNVSRVMAGESILQDAPAVMAALPTVSYSALWITPKTVIIKGIAHETGLKLVVKMTGGQSAGVSNGWSKAVIVSPGMEDDWGDADMTYLYFKTIGVKPSVGEKIFLEMYWLDPASGVVGPSVQTSKVVESEEDAEAEGYVKREKITMADIKPESHVSECDVDFSTNAPVISFDTVCLGHSNVASSEVYLDDSLPAECVGTSMALGRGMGDGNAGLAAQSYIIWLRNPSYGDSYITFAHRGGYYVQPTEVFGPGILY